MKKLFTRTSMGLALAAVVCSTVYAQSLSIKVSDLNLSDPAQMQVLSQRIDEAAHKMCSEGVYSLDLTRKAACEKGVRVEAQEKLASSQSLAAAKSFNKVILAER